jgi:hypothetical protein
MQSHEPTMTASSGADVRLPFSRAASCRRTPAGRHARPFAYGGVYLLVAGHLIKAYVRWGYPLWAHFAAEALNVFLGERSGSCIKGCLA